MNMNLQGRRAIVCGASNGIGRASAAALAALGAEVTIISRNADALMEALASLDVSKGRMHAFLAADFHDLAVLKQKVSVHVATQGPFHILVNNSGGPAAGPALAAAGEDFEKAFRQHLLGNHIMAQIVA